MPQLPISRSYPQDLREGYGIKVARSGGTLTVALDGAALADLGAQAFTTRVAAENIPGLRLVIDAGNNQCRILDATDVTQAGLVLGFVVDPTPAGAIATIQSGAIKNINFNFGTRAGSQLFAGDNGSLSIIPRLSGVFQVVGFTPDGMSAFIRLGPALPIVSLGGGGASVLPYTALFNLLFGTAPAGPQGLAAGSFYVNSGILERTPGAAASGIDTTATEFALNKFWDELSALPPARDGSFFLNDRALALFGLAAGAVLPPPAAFLAALGAFWDARPSSPEGLGSKKFYRNGNTLERTP